MAQSNTAQDITYSREGAVVSKYRELLADKTLNKEQIAQALEDFCTHYERLLDDSKLLTSVGDRLQRKLKGANLMLREQSEEIKRVNGQVQLKNAELQETIDELTRTKVSRRASALLLGVTITAFLLSEIPEPAIEQYFSAYSWGSFVVWIIKGSLALTLAPLQGIIEGRLLKQLARRKERERAEARAAALAAQSIKSEAPVEVKEALPMPAAADLPAGEAGSAMMSVAARKKAEAAQRKAAEETAQVPSIPVAHAAAEPPAVQAAPIVHTGEDVMATMSVAARKKAEAAARQAAQAQQAQTTSTHPQGA